MKRRKFIAGLGSVVAWPLAARAQQAAMPVIGFLSVTAREPAISHVAAVQRGLAEVGYLESRTVSTEFRWAEDQYDRLSELAADLVRHRVAVIVAMNSPAALAAKRASIAIPVVFISGVDPVTSGLVESFNRPGGNTTGIHIWTSSLEAKRLELFHRAVPNAAKVAVLVNPNYSDAERQLVDLRDASQTLGVELLVLKITSESGFASIFATLAERHIGALFVAMDPFLYAHIDQLVALIARHKIFSMYGTSEFVQAGGLMSYGVSLTESYRQAGIYAGRILKGEKPSDLPVQQPTKFELVINLKTARTLRLDIPPTLLALADAVIE
jgi:putative tryptophan/tyrosine transport system substrate-binding protein